MQESTHFYSVFDIAAGGTGVVFQCGAMLLAETANAPACQPHSVRRWNHGPSYWPVMPDENPAGPGLVRVDEKGCPDFVRLCFGLLDGGPCVGHYENRAT